MASLSNRRRIANLDLLADVQQVRYSEVKSISNTLMPNLMQAPLGSDMGAGFGWQDMTTYKFGLQQRVRDGWTWRAGYSYGKQPIPSTEVLFNILAPGVEEQHATFGLSRACCLQQAHAAASFPVITGAFPQSSRGRKHQKTCGWDARSGEEPEKLTYAGEEGLRRLRRLARHGFRFPVAVELGPAASASRQISLRRASRASVGGMVANTSSGVRSVLYGKTIDRVLELRVVLADGSIARGRLQGRDRPALSEDSAARRRM